MSFKTKQEIIDKCETILNKTIIQILDEHNYDLESINQKNKGNIGQIIEELCFDIKKNNKKAPDFEELVLN